MTNERTYQIIIAILVLVIVIGGFAMGRKNTGNDGIVATSTAVDSQEENAGGAMTDKTGGGASSMVVTPVVTNTAQASNESVSVADQAAGMDVAVESLFLNQPSWVAVRDANGRILGAGWFPVGAQSAVSVPLLRGTVAGERYQVLLYVDDGDHVFDFHKDTLLTGQGGSVAGTVFTAQ